jgi:hypothetical protein
MKCSVEGCNRDTEKKDMCQMHYARLRRTGTTDDPRPLQSCKTNGCNRFARWKSGYCSPCYQQQWYLKSVGRTELVNRKRRDYWINSTTGYVQIVVDGIIVYEHRYLAEKALGKPLPKGAVVHHTGAPDDNHGFCKLVICPSQEYHMLLHKRMGDAYNQYT